MTRLSINAKGTGELAKEGNELVGSPAQRLDEDILGGRNLQMFGRKM